MFGVLLLAAASNFWIAMTAGFDLTDAADAADAFSARAIIGIEP